MRGRDVEEALRDELGVGVGDDAARHAELRGEVAARRQAGLWLAAVPSRSASAIVDRQLAPQRAGTRPESEMRNSRSVLDSFIGSAAGSTGESSRTVACGACPTETTSHPDRARHARVRPGRVRGADPRACRLARSRACRTERAVAGLGERLATLNLGLVRVAEPASFAWPGHWIAVVEAADRARRAAVFFGVPSGPLEERDAAIAGAATIVDGYIIAPLDLDAPHGTRGIRPPGTARRRRRAVHRACAGGSLRRAHERRAVRAGRGLEGDRYADGRGRSRIPSGAART